MGLFDKLKRGAKNKFGKALEWVGEKTNWTWLEIKGLEIQINNPVDNLAPTDINRASMQETIDVRTECEKTRKHTEQQAEPYVEKCIEAIEKNIEILMEKLNKILDNASDIINEAEREMFNYSLDEDFVNEAKQTISSYVALHVSEDDEEFVTILKMKTEERKKQSDEFIKRVLDEAEKELNKKCNHKMIEICRKIYNDVDEHFTGQRNLIEELQNNLEELGAHKGDIEHLKKMSVSMAVDVAHAECIRTLTYSDY